MVFIMRFISLFLIVGITLGLIIELQYKSIPFVLIILVLTFLLLKADWQSKNVK